METKASIRKRILAQRDELSAEQVHAYSNLICEQLKIIISEKNVKSVLLYFPIRNEVDPTPLLRWLHEKNIEACLPSIKNDRIVTLKYSRDENLILGTFGIKEPANQIEYSLPFDLIVVPCVAVDKDQYRLGYGKGYYDQFLTTSSPSIGLIYPFQRVEKLPQEPHDKILAGVLTIPID